jgi:hypothetical protein
VDPNGETSEIELLDTSGKLMRIDWSAIIWICYVRELIAGENSGRDSTLPDSIFPERLVRRRFSSRPRIAGLWLRLTLSDGEELEGIAANDRTLIHGIGLLLTPPDTRSNTQRIFLPRSSIRDLSVLAVIGASSPAPSPRMIQGEAQPGLFSGELSS